jgi:hypothetical protein
LQVDNQDRLLKFSGCYFLRFLINLYTVNPATPAPKSTNVEGSGTLVSPLALLSPTPKKVTARNEKIAKMLRFMINLFSVISSFYKIELFLILLCFARSIRKFFIAHPFQHQKSTGQRPMMMPPVHSTVITANYMPEIKKR